MTKNSLFILTNDNKWITAIDMKNKYFSTYMFVKNILDKCEGTGSSFGTATFGSRTVDDLNMNRNFISNDHILTEILKIESHRMCTVAFCRQLDYNTNGLRYMVYGTRYNEDSDYGIGWSLESIDTKYAEQYCPKDITAKFLI